MRRGKTVFPARLRRVVAMGLCGCAALFALAGCGRIPDDVAATLSAPTATPPRATATGRPAAPGGSGGMTPAAMTAAFMLAEMPTGNPTSGQTVYMGGCQNCHGTGGLAGGGMQVSLSGREGLIVSKQLDTAAKFATAFTANAAHTGIKDNDQYAAPNRLTNMYAFLVMQLGT